MSLKMSGLIPSDQIWGASLGLRATHSCRGTCSGRKRRYVKMHLAALQIPRRDLESKRSILRSKKNPGKRSSRQRACVKSLAGKGLASAETIHCQLVWQTFVLPQGPVRGLQSSKKPVQRYQGWRRFSFLAHVITLQGSNLSLCSSPTRPNFTCEIHPAPCSG